MNYFSKRSKENLEECHVTLRNIFNRVLRVHDCSIIEGYRGETKQNQYYYGKPKLSHKKFPESLHNQKPSLAIHAVPYFPDRKLDWDDKKAFIHFAGIVKGVASQMPEKPVIRWGGDWDRDNDLQDQTWDDLAHFELIL